ncbi:preprotein translocase subunit SecG [Flavobacterium agricola]|uniref:Protein-export membrane protein SecG n=1 Tax=Flavobacterium agricola TaxID=2870839 RepID=A0ABY6M0F6_9FLAO|nr:preprotein translocase subunit SecG [Flavobacterium agricola]UYW00606.1 preprotein translocase subunit SecG [Flavobacterium agricola]
MFTLFLVLITIVCLLLIVVIMVQNPKGGGLSSAIGGTQMLGGVQKTSDFLDRSTWTLGCLLMALILLSSISFTSAYGDTGSILIDNTVVPASLPEAPQTITNEVPAETPAE